MAKSIDHLYITSSYKLLNFYKPITLLPINKGQYWGPLSIGNTTLWIPFINKDYKRIKSENTPLSVQMFLSVFNNLIIFKYCENIYSISMQIPFAENYERSGQITVKLAYCAHPPVYSNICGNGGEWRE